MRAMILAAGRGRRMGALTRRRPKPLLRAGGLALIEHLLLALARAGFREVVVNAAYRGALLEEALGDGRRYGLRLRLVREAYGAGGPSGEGPDGERPEGGPAEGLETGGGILHALPLLGPGPFLVVNGDVHTDYPFARLRERGLAPGLLGHLVLVDNPPHHPQGDFALDPGRDPAKEPEDAPEGGAQGDLGRVRAAGPGPRLTFAGIALYRAELLAAAAPRPLRPGRPPCFPLAPVLRRAAAQGRLSGERYRGRWVDVGTPARLGRLRRLLAGGLTPPPAAG